MASSVLMPSYMVRPLFPPLSLATRGPRAELFLTHLAKFDPVLGTTDVEHWPGKVGRGPHAGTDGGIKKEGRPKTTEPKILTPQHPYCIGL